ncbi:MAG: radical SAM protein [Chlorobi bacterium]|nr:radical SAM protein [Chlorobiota bacterium]
MKAFGPIPSRRLGKSLGINNIPPKICSYSCVYCQLGKAIIMDTERQFYFDPDELVSEVKDKIRQVNDAGETIDYLTFVPDGEPTLDINLGKEIRALKNTGIKVAVITNSSLLWREDVREDLSAADWVSVKVDSVLPDNWKKTDCPHKTLDLNKIRKGILDFADIYQGKLVTETMLVKGYNDDPQSILMTATCLEKVYPDVAYIGIPTRPPAVPTAEPAGEEAINLAYQEFSRMVPHVELILGYEGNAFAYTGNIEEDILSITAVHPMRREAVEEMLRKAELDWSVIDQLIRQEKISEVDFNGHHFYMRKLKKDLSV